MYQEQILKYYSEKKMLSTILEASLDREVVPVLFSGNFGKRPNAVFYERDVEQLVKQGAISFHGSVERWKNPLALRTDMRKSDFDRQRIGWDLIIDIDCDRELSYAKKAAKAICRVLSERGLKSYSIKFSGNRGFHIGVPFEAFPEKIMGLGEVSKHFPQMPKMLIDYMKYLIKGPLQDDFGEDPDNVLVLDSGLISSRHLIRLPYCLHRKTWLVSLPLKESEIDSFKKEDAQPDKVSVKTKFLEKEVEENEALELLQSAVSWSSSRKTEERTVQKFDFKLPAAAIKTEFFPPCVNNILAGLEDGRKRSVFVLTTYLHNIGWKQDDIEKLLLSWNQKNSPALRDNFVKATIKSQYTGRTPQMAPNCSNLSYMKGYGACTPDEFCKTIKNPVTYTLNKVKLARKYRKKPRKKKSVKKEGKE
jgi:hypothetical protein